MVRELLIISSVTLIVLAEKLPDASRFTIALAVFALVAALASTVAAAILAAVCPPTKLTTVAPCVPVTSPTNDPEKLVAVVAVVAIVALVALPLKFAVIVPAEKLPEASRLTIILALLKFGAVIASIVAAASLAAA